MKTLDAREMKEVLNQGWMTHDGMWFANSLMELGIEKTNELNLRAVRGMASGWLLR